MCTMITYEAHKSENFSNLLSDFYNKATFSDLALHIGDLSNPSKQPLVIHSHLLVLHSASEYIRRYLSCFLNDPTRSSISIPNALLPNQLQLTLQLDYARSGLDDEVIALFFSLFYVTRFDEAHLRANNLEEPLHHNILVLYDLALYFLFDALSAYIEQYFKASMCLAYFTPLSLFCLTLDPLTATYSTEKQRGASVYKRLAQWYTCCVSEQGSVEEPATVDASTVCDYEYFTRNKKAILQDMARIENCRLPKKEARRIDASTICLDYHRNICEACMGESTKDNAVGAFYYLDMGCVSLRYTNGVERFFLRLKKKKHPDSRSTTHDNRVELTMNRTMTSPPPYKKLRTQEQRWMGPTNEQDRYECESRISLLSRKKHKDKSIQRHCKKNIFIPTEINNFDMHAPKYCYEGRCDHCSTMKPVYIMLIRIRLTKENHNDPPLEDMSMMVEESTAQ